MTVGKPRLRGVIHEYAFFVALAAGPLLVFLAPDARARVAAGIYAVGLAGLLGTSALYHRLHWRPAIRRWLRRLDHSMIFVLIAGTYTPIALLTFSTSLSTVIMVLVWSGALGGVVLSLAWPDAPKWVMALVYVALGSVGVIAVPEMVTRTGLAATFLVLGGGVLYVAGAVIYARGRPDPWPKVFGYHELFHVLVVVAAGLHYAAIAAFVLPAG